MDYYPCVSPDGAAIAFSSDRTGNDEIYVMEFAPTAVAEGGTPTLEGSVRLEARPNPFNPRTIVSFSLERSERVSLRIYDLSGRQVAELFNESLPAGAHHHAWNGRDSRGRRLASGTYLLRLQAETETHRGKVTMVE
jgi:hypothetical protein